MTPRKKRASDSPAVLKEDAFPIHILSHTHWDFEWYEVQEGFKMQLVHLMGNLLDILDKDPTFKFHFDGQVLPLMDYFEVLRERDALDDGNTEKNSA